MSKIEKIKTIEGILSGEIATPRTWLYLDGEMYLQTEDDIEPVTMDQFHENNNKEDTILTHVGAEVPSHKGMVTIATSVESAKKLAIELRRLKNYKPKNR